MGKHYVGKGRYNRWLESRKKCKILMSGSFSKGTPVCLGKPYSSQWEESQEQNRLYFAAYNNANKKKSLDNELGLTRSMTVHFMN